MSQSKNNYYDSMTEPERRAGADMDIEGMMERYTINLSAARVLKVIDHLVRASQKRGVKDRRGIPYCYASKEWIAGKLGKSARTIARAIHDLKAAGLIECKRTRSNAMLFITGYEASETAAPEPEARPSATAEPMEMPTASASSSAPVNATNGTSGTATNGTSNIENKSYNIPDTSSIHRSNTPDRDDGGERSAHLPPPQGPALPREHFDAYRRRLYDQLCRQMILTGAGDDMAGPCVTSAHYIADVVASNQDVKINGITMSAGQYWEVVQHVNGGHLCETLSAIAARDCLGMIRNKRAYLLTSAYNCALWDRFREAEVNFQQLQKLADGMTGRPQA